MPNAMHLVHTYPVFVNRVAPFFAGKDARQLEPVLWELYRHDDNYKYQGLALWVCVAAAEFGFWSLEGGAVRYAAAATTRRLGWIAAAAVATGLVASLVLAAASGVSAGAGLEAAGVGAAVLTVAAVAVLAARSSV